ncbi:MAG: PAS domain-containing protein [Nitrosomonadales bacterium]|nr:PAS domain-containing protein [Nitrosomonadales bacterium]
MSLPPQDLWRPLSLFNFYRLFLGCLFIFLVGLFGNTLSLGSSDLPLFFRASIIYVVMVLVSQLATRLRQPRFGLQLAFQVGTDVACITVLSHASGGVQSNLGMLLLVSLAAAGLISRGRTTLFFAALASIAALLQHSYAVLNQEAEITQYVQVGLLSIAYFAIAWLAHTLAKYAIASEDLAVRRGVDLANMAEANRLAIQDMPDGVLVVDERGVVRQHNPSAERLLGYQFPEAGEVTLEDCSPLLMERLAAWRQNHGHESEVLRLGAIGHRLRVRFLPVQREGFWGAVLFIEDIQRMQAQAQQIKLAALGRLTANVAHEVRNPLSAISYATELLQEGAHEPAQERMFQIIMDNAARLNRIVQDVMQLNRRDRVQAEPLLLADLLPGFIAGLSQAERVERSVFSIEAEEACVVNFDRGHLDQILWNLCCNALRYCRKLTGSIKLSVWRMGEGRVILDIIDDGPGVAPEVVPQLFEPFFTTATGGAGLGLYIARELSEANGATLDYWRQEGSGACFRIVFGGQDEH